jgi:PAS domain S-box-containing protein
MDPGQATVTEALSQSEARLAALIARVPGIVYRLVPEEGWRAEFVSDAVEVMTGYPAGDFCGVPPDRSLLDIVAEDDRDRVARARLDGFQGEAVWLEYRIVDAAGDERHVYEQGGVAYDPTETARWLDGIIFDISDRKLAEQELERLQFELQLAQRLETVGRLSAGMAHEINTPLQFVADSVQFLQESFRDALALIEEQAQLVEQLGGDDGRARMRELADRYDLDYVRDRAPAAFDRALKGVGRVGELVRELKTFARDDRIGQRIPTDVAEQITTTLAVAHSEYERLADVATELEPVAPVLCDPADLNHALLNLVVNAAAAIADAERERGTITVRTRMRGRSVVIEVEDDGCGMDEHVQRRAFDPFFTTRDVGAGVGQGLTLARAAVRRHGGTLTCASTPAVGSTFTVELPAAI